MSTLLPEEGARGGEASEPLDISSPARGGSEPIRRSPRKSPEAAARAAKELESMQQEMMALGKLPWCGQADKLGATEKEIISHYEHFIVFEDKLKHGRLYKEPYIIYRTQYEPVGKQRKMSMKGLNVSRLGDALLKLESTPGDVKEKVARKMRSTLAKEYISSLEAKRKSEVVDDGTSELLIKRKTMKADGKAVAKEEERHSTIEKYVAKDAAMPPDLFNTCLYYMGVFFIMCRIPFAVAHNRYFVKFIQSLRPVFLKLLPSHVSQRAHVEPTLCLHGIRRSGYDDIMMIRLYRYSVCSFANFWLDRCSMSCMRRRRLSRPRSWLTFQVV